MSKSLKFILLAGVASLPLPALAQEFGGAITFGYGIGEISDLNTDIDSATIDGDISVDLGNGFSLGARGSYANIDIDMLPIDISGNLLGLNAAYSFGGGAWMGAYTEHSDISIDMLPVNFGLTHYGIEGGYKAANYGVSGFAGKGSDLTSYGIAASYNPMAGTVLGANAMRSELSFSGIDADISTYGVAAAHSFTGNFGVFAGVGRSTISGVDADLTTYGIGGSYTFTQLQSPIVASLELARTDLNMGGSGTDFDTVRLGLTFPFGNKASVVPNNSVAGAILNPSHSAISQTVLMAF